MKRLEQTEYTVKLHEGVKSLLFLYLNCPKIIIHNKKEDIIGHVINTLKQKNNRPYYIITYDVLEEIKNKENENDIAKIKTEIVKISLINYMENIGLGFTVNYLYNMVDREEMNEDYLLNEKTLRYFDNQLYYLLLDSVCILIYDIIIRLKNTGLRGKNIAITEKTFNALYDENVQNKQEKFLKDLGEWITYNNLDYFLNIEERDEKIIIKVHI